jgi:tetratricopeptide (TPR) repeat protein
LNVNAIRYRQTVPPSRPSIFYGRDGLVAELTDLVVNDVHIALIGPGGMGKSSLAKAILNEPLIAEKFADRRFFVTYDGLDPLTITFDAFMSRFAENLGMDQVGADPIRQISTFLRSSRALVVLDNAETFEEASGSPSLKEIPPAIAEIASIPGVIIILTSRSRRNAPDVEWITKDVPALDANSAQDVFFRIYRGAARAHAEEEIKDLLGELEFHPLSISILANAAHQNSWSPATLVKRWNEQHSKLLDRGSGKLQSLSSTMQLSLGSPTIQALGQDGLRALAVIAFLPQGLNDDMARDLLPSIPQINNICDVLCSQSLLYRQGSFVKMLAPVRHYVRDSLSRPDATCLRDIRVFYHRAVEWRAQQQDNFAGVIISDHLNIEHMVAFCLGHVEDDEGDPYDLCLKFLSSLQYHLPRPTTLMPAIFNIQEDSSTWRPKAFCLERLALLYETISHLSEAAKAFQAAEILYLNTGDNRVAAGCVISRAEIYKNQGRFIQSTRLLQDFQRSESWNYLDTAMKAELWLFLDLAQMYIFIASADELFVQRTEDHTSSMGFKIGHWRVKLFYGGDIVQAKTYLEELLVRCRRPENHYYHAHALRALAEAAYCQGNLSECMDRLHILVEYYVECNSPETILWYTVWQAVLASDLGNYDLARELIQKSPGPLEFLTSPGARTFVHRTYSSAHIELAAGEYAKAESLFAAAIEGCDMQGDLRVKAYCIRALGEVSYVHGDCLLAGQRFTETRALCTEMGVPPRKMYSFAPFDSLPERFEGWALFLDGQSPFAAIM